jgi:hypothetical protein
MKFPETRYFVPPPHEAFGVIRFSQAFYQEVSYRAEHQRHCQWYAEVSAQHRAELRKMERDINPLRWFRR